MKTSRQRSYAFSHRGAHFCLIGDWEKRGDLIWQTVKPYSETPNRTSCQNHKHQLLRPHSGRTRQSSTYPNNRGERTVSTEKISKKGIKLIIKTIANRKGNCAWSCSRWQTQSEKICKLKSTNQYIMRSEWHWFVRCDLQVFSGCVCHLEQLHAQSPFLFPIVFSINMNLPLIKVPWEKIPFFFSIMVSIRLLQLPCLILPPPPREQREALGSGWYNAQKPYK